MIGKGFFYCSKFACNAFYGGFGFGWCLLPMVGLGRLKRGLHGVVSQMGVYRSPWGCFSFM
ncbi:hypothetical protein AO364_1888 [Moraxella catarrhalis]|nr:hypothetical protein AO364_1888 [Moraxella catarrhalis]